MSPRAAIIAIGDEITLGQSLDTNSQWLAGRLTELGFVTVAHLSVPDDEGAIAEAFASLASRCEAIVCTGGLGPTADDLTRPALARAMGTALELDEGALAQIEAYFAKRSRLMTDAQRTQAMRPKGAESIANANGTAPGTFGRIGSAAAWCLPGPPGEMRPMFEAHAAPRLRQMRDERARATGQPPTGVVTRLVHCCGITEADAAAKLGDLLARDRRPVVGITVGQTVVTLRARFEGPLADADAALDDTERRIREALGAHVFGVGEATLGAALVARLAERQETLVCAESCTGGLLSAALTEPAGASAAVLGGWVVYSNEFKRDRLGVEATTLERFGAVSAETARALAVGALRESRATHALSITGIAGPTGATPGKPVGTVFIACGSGAGSGEPVIEVRRFLFAGDRATVRIRSAQQAMAMLWFRLGGAAPTRLVGETPLEGNP